MPRPSSSQQDTRTADLDLGYTQAEPFEELLIRLTHTVEEAELEVLDETSPISLSEVNKVVKNPRRYTQGSTG